MVSTLVFIYFGKPTLRHIIRANLRVLTKSYAQF